MTKELSISELAALAAEMEDQTEVVSGGDFERELVDAGPTIGRFIEYIELGKQPQKPYQGKDKPPAEEVRLTFELLHPTKNIKEYEADGVKKKRGQIMSVKLKKSLSDKAAFKKLFNAMQYGRDDRKHFAQMLGEAFMFNITHNTSKNTEGKEVTYANLRNADGVWGISAPVVSDPLAGTSTNIADKVPANIAPLRVFLWNNPTPTTWESLFIDGTSEQKDKDGNVTQVSKNWLQELIQKAINYKGSPLDLMLTGLDDLPANEEPASSEAEKPVEEKKASPATADATGSQDALAALGLV